MRGYKKIFVCGAVFGIDVEESKKFDVYENVLKKLYPETEIVVPNTISQFRNDFIKANPQVSEDVVNTKMSEFDLRQVKESDCLVCDLSLLSTGLGLELGVALENRKTIFCFAKTDSKISNLVLGTFAPNGITNYDSLDMLAVQLKEKLI